MFWSTQVMARQSPLQPTGNGRSESLCSSISESKSTRICEEVLMKSFVFVSLVFLVACGQAEQEAAEAALNPNKKATNTAQVTTTEAFAPAAGATWNTYYVADASNLPVCDFDREGQLFFVASEKKFYACASNDWGVVELKGRDGLAG